MANYVVSYDLNGNVPTHAEMDKHMEAAGWTRGRILETVWYVGTDQTRSEVFKHVDAILSKNDQVFVVEGIDMSFRNLLITNESIKESWSEWR